MAFQSAPECASATFEFLGGGVPMVNVLHFWKPGGYDLTALQALADGLNAQAVIEYMPLITPDVTYGGCVVRGLEFEADQTAFANDGAGAGTGTGTSLANNVSACITLRSDFTGRSQRGRFYAVPGRLTYLETATTFTSAYIDALVSMLDEFLIAGNTAGWTMVILSRFHNGVKRTTAVHSTVTTIVARNNKVDSQRGRLGANH